MIVAIKPRRSYFAKCCKKKKNLHQTELISGRKGPQTLIEFLLCLQGETDDGML